MVRVIKRNGSMVDFDKTKIELAILNAMKNGSGMMNEYIAKTIANEIFEKLRYTNENVTIYQIENDVYFKLIEYFFSKFIHKNIVGSKKCSTFASEI